MLRQTRCALLGTTFGATKVPPIVNEPAWKYAAGTAEAAELKKACDKVLQEKYEVPTVIGGQEYRVHEKTREYPGCHRKATKFFEADRELMDKAIANALETRKTWSRVPFYHRAAIFLKAAHLLTTTHRYSHMAATMVGQGKTAWQAEIDCIDEAADFFRFHVSYAQQLYETQPFSTSNATVWNTTEYRPLEGFVVAITPFNFSAIGANLAVTPALMGNVVLWKPSDLAVLANYRMVQLLEECGLPPGVINFVPNSPPPHSNGALDHALKHRSLAGVAFTGSTRVFHSIAGSIAQNIESYCNFPRLSGETGGKNFHLIHPSADMQTVVGCTIRSTFEYQGQKCSACGRVFAPQSCWPKLREALVEEASKINVGPTENFENFMGPVISESAYSRILSMIKAGTQDGSTVLVGGKGCKSDGWFIEPTIMRSPTPDTSTMVEEIFGPVMTVYVYDDSKPNAWEDVCAVIDKSKYGLTGSIFARDRAAIATAQDLLRYSSGMLYINDKSTGAVVGQQPFGGARASGTNDKPGGPSFVQRWVSERSIKETMSYERGIAHAHMGDFS